MPTVKTAKRPTVTGHEMLCRYVTDKPRQLKTKICKAMNAGGVVWRHASKPNIDSPEICTWDGLSFLGNGKAKSAWEMLWKGSNAPALRWDTIGRVQIGNVGWNWLLVSAMTHLDLMSVATPKRQSNLTPAMATYLSDAKRKYKVDDNVIWPAKSSYVQQLAALAFLRNHGVCVELLNIYMFDADNGPSKHDWQSAIDSSHQALAISDYTALRRRMHQLFLPVI